MRTSWSIDLSDRMTEQETTPLVQLNKSGSHRNRATPMRYIRAVQLQHDVGPLQLVYKFATNEVRPPVMAAVNIDLTGRGERIRTSDLSVPNRAHYQAVLRPEEVEAF